MAAAMTYDSLVSDIEVYAENTNAAFLTQIPRFIMLAENRLASTIRGLGYLQNVTGTLTLHDGTLVKPNRWRETSSFSITDDGERTFLKPRTYEFCRAYAPNDSVYYKPVYYSDYGYEHFLLAGAPDQAYPFELNYFERPEPLDATHQTSWTTQYAPQLLLYASLLEAQPYLMRQEKLMEYKSFKSTIQL
jgi:hypothetical protein